MDEHARANACVCACLCMQFLQKRRGEGEQTYHTGARARNKAMCLSFHCCGIRLRNTVVTDGPSDCASSDTGSPVFS